MYKQLPLKARPKPCQQHIKYSILNIKFLPLLLFLALFSAPAQAKYSGGAGTPEAPYKIADYNDLYTLADDTEDYNKHFCLTADIDLNPILPGRNVRL